MGELLDAVARTLELASERPGSGAMALRALIVFLAGLVMLRLGSKRFMGRSTAFDVLLAFMLGSMLSRAITGNSPFLPTLGAGLVLIALHWIMGALAYRWPAAGSFFKGRPTPLVRDGEPCPEELRRAHITRHDMEEAIRLKGLVGRPLREAWLERSGEISVVTGEAEGPGDRAAPKAGAPV